VSLEDQEMELERPKIVTLALVILAVSLAYRIYGELAILSFLYPDPADYGLSFFGWGLLLMSFYIAQVLILWNVARGRNWARIITILLVSLRLGIAVLILVSPFAPIAGSLLVALTQVVAEVFALVLLVFAKRFFRPSGSVA